MLNKNFLSRVIEECDTVVYNKSYRKGTARHAMSAEIVSAAAQLYKKCTWKGQQEVHDLESHSRSSEMTRFVRPYCTSLLVSGLQYHFSILHRLQDITTSTV